MCIIAYKSPAATFEGHAFEWLENCFRRNRDGAGFMYRTTVEGKQRVRIVKGLMTLEQWWQAFSDHNLIEQSEIVFHFRIATHGGSTAAHTHPFPITDDDALLKALDVTAPVGLVHNGVISQMPRQADLSDTMLFVKHYLAPLKSQIYNPAVMGMMDFVSSKFAIMTSREVALYGSFFEEAGWHFSHKGYEIYNHTYVPWDKHQGKHGKHAQHDIDNYDEYISQFRPPERRGKGYNSTAGMTARDFGPFTGGSEQRSAHAGFERIGEKPVADSARGGSGPLTVTGITVEKGNAEPKLATATTIEEAVEKAAKGGDHCDLCGTKEEPLVLDPKASLYACKRCVRFVFGGEPRHE